MEIVKKILEEHFKKKSDEVQTVYIGVDEEKFNPDRYNKEELEKKIFRWYNK